MGQNIFRLRSGRLVAGIAAFVLLFGAVAMAYHLGRLIYFEYYLFPKVKDYHAFPTGWRDLLAIALLCAVDLALAFSAVALFRYSFRTESG